VRKHLARNRKDRDGKFRLMWAFPRLPSTVTDKSSLIESRIYRLARYYKTVGVLPPTWRYESSTANTLVS
jgi:small subunit ribosomal protein S13e